MHPEVPGVLRIELPMPGPLGGVNAYVLHDGGESLLVDTGLPGSAPEVAQTLQVYGLPQPKAIFLTHAHLDHSGAAEELATAWQVPLYVAATEAEALRRQGAEEAPSLQASWFSMLGAPREEARELANTVPRRVPPSSWIAPPAALSVGGQVWQVVLTPGHSPGHLSLWRQEDGTLLGGDLLLPDETPNVSLVPGGAEDPLGDYLASLELVAGLQVQALLPGHRKPTRDLLSLLEATRAHHRLRLADVVQAVEAGARSVYEVALAIPWSERRQRFSELGPLAKRLALGEAAAHVRHLERLGRLRRTEEGYVPA